MAGNRGVPIRCRCSSPFHRVPSGMPVRHAPMRSFCCCRRSSPWLAFGYYAACRAKTAPRAGHSLCSQWRRCSPPSRITLNGLLAGINLDTNRRVAKIDPVPSIFIEADFETLPEQRRRFALLNIPRHLFSEATAAAARRTASPRPVSSGVTSDVGTADSKSA